MNKESAFSMDACDVSFPSLAPTFFGGEKGRKTMLSRVGRRKIDKARTARRTWIPYKRP